MKLLETSSYGSRCFGPVEQSVRGLVVLTSEQKYGRDWEGNHRVNIDVAGQKVGGIIAEQGKEQNPFNPYWKYVISKIGGVTIDNPVSTA